MKFIGTRGGSGVSFSKAISLCFDEKGGLFVPESFPQIDENALKELFEMNYAERAAKIISLFLDEDDSKDILEVCSNAYAKFHNADPATTVKIDDNLYVLELFRGPSLSFRDISILLLPYFLEKAKTKNTKYFVLTASTADTAKSALETFKDKKGYKVCALYSVEGISKMQKIHIATQTGSNVFVLATKGCLDDCRNMAIDLFNGKHLQEKGYTPIFLDQTNIIFIISQIPVWFSAYADLITSKQISYGEQIDLVIPAGSLSTATAAYYAKLMGLPIRKIHCASNINKGLADFLKTGKYETRNDAVKTTSPALDVIYCANIERILFETFDRDANSIVNRIDNTGEVCLNSSELQKLNAVFDGGYTNEEDAIEATYEVFEDTGYAADPQTGCALKIMRDFREHNKKDFTKIIIPATVNPFKFPQDVLYAVSGNDVKDCFKGMKRLYGETAMTPPKSLKELRDTPLRFNHTSDRKKLLLDLSEFL